MAPVSLQGRNEARTAQRRSRRWGGHRPSVGRKADGPLQGGRADTRAPEGCRGPRAGRCAPQGSAAGRWLSLSLEVPGASALVSPDPRGRLCSSATPPGLPSPPESGGPVGVGSLAHLTKDAGTQPSGVGAPPVRQGRGGRPGSAQHPPGVTGPAGSCTAALLRSWSGRGLPASAHTGSPHGDMGFGRLLSLQPPGWPLPPARH